MTIRHGDETIEIYLDPGSATIRIVFNEGDGGIFELDLGRHEYGVPVVEVPEGWLPLEAVETT